MNNCIRITVLVLTSALVACGTTSNIQRSPKGEATVAGPSGDSLGQVTTDKNRWALGGGIAATQTVQSFMQGAAEVATVASVLLIAESAYRRNELRRSRAEYQ